MEFKNFTNIHNIISYYEFSFTFKMSHCSHLLKLLCKKMRKNVGTFFQLCHDPLTRQSILPTLTVYSYATSAAYGESATPEKGKQIDNQLIH